MKLRRNTVLFLLIYALATTGCILGRTRGWHALEYVCKPVLMISLGIWFFLRSRRYGDRFTLLVQAGLFFSLLGDVVLMLDHIDGFFFLIGLAAFALVHLCYTVAFAQNIFEAEGTDGLVVGSSIGMLVLAVGLLVANDLSRRLDMDLLVPVLVYAGCITLMGISAAFRYQRTFAPSFRLVMLGALLFMLSDALLANDRFVSPGTVHPAFVILPYAVAQLLIAVGCLAHILDPESIRKKAALDA